MRCGAVRPPVNNLGMEPRAGTVKRPEKAVLAGGEPARVPVPPRPSGGFGCGEAGGAVEWTRRASRAFFPLTQIIAFCTRPPTARSPHRRGGSGDRVANCEGGRRWGLGSAGLLHVVSWLFLQAHWNRGSTVARPLGGKGSTRTPLAFSLVEKLESKSIKPHIACIPMDLEIGDWHLATP